MNEITIYLKNGSKLSAFTELFTVKKTQEGLLAGIEWKNGKEEQERLLYVDVDDISAITSRPVEEGEA